jgi:hypothetical protein
MMFLLVILLALISQLAAAAPGLLPSPTGPLGPVISREYNCPRNTRYTHIQVHVNPSDSRILVLGNLGNFEPPPLIYTQHPSPECAVTKGGNGGELQCCRAAIAGDQPIVEFLAKIYGYKLNRNDVNGVVCKSHCPISSPDPLGAQMMVTDTNYICSGDNQIDTCPGVRMCCQVTALVSSSFIYGCISSSSDVSRTRSCLCGARTITPTDTIQEHQSAKCLDPVYMF